MPVFSKIIAFVAIPAVFGARVETSDQSKNIHIGTVGVAAGAAAGLGFSYVANELELKIKSIFSLLFQRFRIRFFLNYFEIQTSKLQYCHRLKVLQLNINN